MTLYLCRKPTWIGLNETATMGTFIWQDGTPLTFNHSWIPGDHGCVIIRTSGVWKVILCTKERHYICSKSKYIFFFLTEQ